MKSCLLTFIFLLLCIFIEGTKHEKRKDKHTKTKSETAEKNVSKITSTNKSKVPAIGLFSLNPSKKSKHSKPKKNSKRHTKKSKSDVLKLLKKFKWCLRIYGVKRCKKKNFKKAMIWPKKMLPALEKMLLNKLNGGNAYDNGYDNYDNPIPSASPSVDKNDFADNWDSVKPSRRPRSHHNMFNGMEVVPMLKMLKERVGDSSPYDVNTFTGAPSTQGGLTKLLLNQALGKPDRGSVMKDMMQEFSLANGNDRSGEEAREAFNELIGHNNLVRANSDMGAENSDFNVGQSPGVSDSEMGRMSMPEGRMSMPEGRMNMPERVQSFSPQGVGGDGGGDGDQAFQSYGGGGAGAAGGTGGGGGVVQAQELPNGKIAPVNQPLMGSNMQQMMPINVNPTTRMLSSEKVSNDPLESQIMESQMPTSVAVMHDSRSRPIPFSRNNNLVFEEEGESAARGIKPPPFAGGNPFYAENVMHLGPSYQSSTITEPDVGAAQGALEMQGSRYATAFGGASYPSTPVEMLASRRNDLPVNRKQHKNTGKTPMRSSDLPTRPHNKNLKKTKHSTKTS